MSSVVPLFFVLLLLTCLHAVRSEQTVTIFNNRLRWNVEGKIVDAHDGMILAHTFPNNGSTLYFLYGEHYGNTTGAPYPSGWGNYPQMAVYTSPDLIQWTYRGPAVPAAVGGTKWIPNVFYDSTRERFVMWYGCGQWCVAESADGLSFTNVTLQESRYGNSDSTDGTGVFIDDDGAGYVIFSSPNHQHVVSIERLTPDYLASTKQLVATFPDEMVESPSLFKREGIYYATYGSCCCACRSGSGQVVLWATNIAGPWKKQYPYADINCDDPNAQICGDFHSEVSKLVYNAQWWGPSMIPLASGQRAVMFTGRRWLSGPNNPAACSGMCVPAGDQQCTAPTYRLAQDYDVWYVLEFTADGHIEVMKHRDHFNITLP
jgi:hypothetical protein